jgi:hypothetical protein
LQLQRKGLLYNQLPVSESPVEGYRASTVNCEAAMSSNKPRNTPPTSEEIAFCAYLLWEKEGRPTGREIIHWLQAEEQLLADFAQDAGMLDDGITKQFDFRKLRSPKYRQPREVRVQ